MSQDPYRYFRVEARELADQLSQGVLALERAEMGAEHIAKLLRLAHTLKGAARVVKQVEIGDEAHAIEDVLEPMRNAPKQLAQKQADALLARLDVIGKRIAALGAPEQVQEQGSLSVMRADTSEMNALLEGLGEAATRLRALDQLVETLAANGALSPAVAYALSELTQRSGREVQQVTHAAERLRLAPAKALFPALERAAREAARAQKKEVALVASGGESRLEASALASVQTALIQCIRNAIFHGIARRGTVRISVQTVDRAVVFRCDDDGRGIDFAAVRNSLRLAGKPVPESEAGLVDILLRGGVSTAKALDQEGGRGVGMDLIRTSVAGLGGSVTMENLVGGGARVELRVPISLLAFEALAIVCDDTTVTLPLGSIAHSMRVTPNELVRTADGISIAYNGGFVPFAHLGDLIATPKERTPAQMTVVVLRGVRGLAALSVDRMLGRREVIVRPLPPLAPASKLVFGASLDAHGDPVIALDVENVLAAARRAQPTAARGTRARLPILVVDDSLTTRMLEQNILESAGYEVELATSGEEGLQKALLRRYGLFLVDVEMPGIDGFTFVERARSEPRLEKIPAILVTSRNAPEDVERGKRVGAQGYMVKQDFDQGVLLERIRSFLE